MQIRGKVCPKLDAERVYMSGVHGTPTPHSCV